MLTGSKKEVKKRLKNAFKGEWEALSFEQKEKAIDAYLIAIEPLPLDPRDAIERAFRRNVDFGLFFLAAGFGIVITLFADALIETIEPLRNFLGNWYVIVLGFGVLIMLFLINNFFENVVNRDLRDLKVLDQLLK